MYVYLLAGQNLELSEKEVEGFLKSQDIDNLDTHRDNRLLFNEAHPQQLRRLAMTHEVSELIEEAEMNDFKPSINTEGSFCVRTTVLEGDKNSKEVEKNIGAQLTDEGNEVDLENPETIFKAYIINEKIYFCRLVEDIPRGLFEKRKNDKRPFSSPISLSPVLARTVVNLTGLSPGKVLFDPFCGTGGILIEAGLCGIGVEGCDIDERNVEGCRENLEFCGIINHNIVKKDFNEHLKSFNDFDAVVTDLPYGKSTKSSEDALENFIEFVNSVNMPVVFIYNESEFRGLESSFEIYMHKNLSRYIYIV